MRDIIRRSEIGRCGFALIIFFVSIAGLRGQDGPATKETPAAKEPTRSAATSPPTDVTPPVPPPEPAKSPETTPVKSAEGAPAQNPEAAPARVPQSQPVVSQPQGKGKAPAKKGQNIAVDDSGGLPTFIGVQKESYIIGPEDVLYLSVLHQQDVSGALNVRPDGFVTVRFAGDIKAAGLTCQKLSDIVTEKLTQYFNHPEVNIQVAKVNSKKYYLSGQVRRPGAYPLSTPKTIYEALIEGGGPADFAKAKKIYILRGHQRIPFNYNDVKKGLNLEQNILLQNGDVIEVP